MNNETLYVLLAIIAATLGTALTRFLPFLILKKHSSSHYLKYLQNTMPLLIMTLLVFYSLSGLNWQESYGIYEILGILCSALCFLWFKNAVLSIFAGIIFYMVMIRFF
ncbi:branched-chain amino acid transporter permease [Helicobacter burdigaliensis]|uniref:branched-chain amino acid transporter permease n=1 Tax=Helicobacter burdigaliensis TaxID=2315334 RepID=UPI000EF6E61C|nr:AzlD domain-containing protein [Helicobacter burdigaliensis]